MGEYDRLGSEKPMGDGGKIEKPEQRIPTRAAEPDPQMPQAAPLSSELQYRASGGRSGTPPLDRILGGRQAAGANVMQRLAIMRKVGGAADVGSSGQAKIPEGSGSPLSGDIRARMEPKLGADLSTVRVHTGADSAAAAKDFGARAFTVGSDVHFNAGQFSPGSKEGDKLLAHELTHVVQGQKSGIRRKEDPDAKSSDSADPKGGDDENKVSKPGEAAEVEADAVSEQLAGDLHGDDKKGVGDSKPRAEGDGKQGASPGPAAGGEASAEAAVEQKPSAIAAKLEPGAVSLAKAAPASKEKPSNEIVATLQVNADTESVDRTKLTLKELQAARVGHAWITLKYKDASKIPAAMSAPTQGLLKKGGSSMGFWPLIHRAAQWDPRSAQYAKLQQRLQSGFTPGSGASDNPDHTGFSKNPFNSNVPGRVEEPDDAHGAKASKSYDLTQAQVDSLMAYVNGKRGASYSLYFFNCTTFAVEAAAAAGQAAPGGAMMGICLPNALYRDILEMKLGGDANAVTTKLGAGERETPSKRHR